MNIIQEEILKVIEEFNLDVELIIHEDYKILIRKVISTFMNNNSNYPLWSNIVDKNSIKDSNAWKLIPDFAEKDIILFLEKEDAEFAIMMKHPKQLKILLENSFQFVFYLTNPLFDYLLCFNDHDYLIGSGKAKKWIESISGNVSK